MKLAKTLLGSTLLAISYVVTSSIAIADGHMVKKHKAQFKYFHGKKKPFCKKRGYQVLWKNNIAWCVKKGHSNQKNFGNHNQNNHFQNKCPAGSKAVKNRQGQIECAKLVNNNFGGGISRGYTKVEWKYLNKQKTPVCTISGHNVYQRGNQFRCYANGAAPGWQKWKKNNLRIGGNGSNNGVNSMKNNTKYDNYRYFKGNNVQCRKGKLWFDKGFRAHCRG